MSVTEDENWSKDCVPFKVLKMMTPDANIAFCWVDEVNIGLVQDNVARADISERGSMYQHHKKSQAKFLHLIQLEYQK